MILSVVIPVYKVEQTLDKCLKSIVSQTYADLDIILVDDGSPDKCPQMCDDWAKRDSRIKVIHKPNGGLSDARNAGIDVAKGEYITFVDSDDFVGFETYKQLMHKLSVRLDIDILEYPVYWHYGSKKQRVMSFGSRLFSNTNDYWLSCKAYEHTYAWNKIYRRELFKDIRFPEGRVFEDAATYPLLLRKAKLIATTTEGIYHYSSNPKGITAMATGKELKMLLDSHLSIMKDSTLLNDTRYYLHVLNIQIDVCKQTGEMPTLPYVKANPLAPDLTINQRLKAIALRILGINRLCKIVSSHQKTTNSQS